MENDTINSIIQKFKQGRRLDPKGLLCRNPNGDGNIFLVEVNYDPTQSDEDYGEHIYAAYYPCTGDSPEMEEDKLDFAQLQDFDSFTQQRILKSMSGERPPIQYDDEEDAENQT